MRRILIVFTAVSFLFPLYGQDIKVRRIKKIPIEQEAFFPDFGSSKKEIIFTGQNHRGLYHYNLRNKNRGTIVGRETVVKSFSAGSNDDVLYSIQRGVGSNKRTMYLNHDLKNDASKEIDSPYKGRNSVGIDGKRIILKTNHGEEKYLAPTGDNYYVWASLSPDNKKILFTAVGKGTFVSDLDGNIILEAGTLNAPVWINNEWVLGMDDKDDGYVITGSELFAVNINSGEKIKITEKTDEIALYPKVSQDGERIMFHNLKGEVFTARIKVKE
jgi:Tol biopolymer transport system component